MFERMHLIESRIFNERKMLIRFVQLRVCDRLASVY